MKMILFNRKQLESLLRGEVIVLSRKRRRTGYGLKENHAEIERLEKERRNIEEKIRALKGGEIAAHPCTLDGCKSVLKNKRALSQHIFWKHGAGKGRSPIAQYQNRKKTSRLAGTEA